MNVISHTNGSHLGRVFSGVCLSVRFVHLFFQWLGLILFLSTTPGGRSVADCMLAR